jgi:hypothetical protein
VCVNAKMIPIETTIPGMKGGGIKESSGVEMVNSAMIYCKNFCKCHNVPSSSTTIKKLSERNVKTDCLREGSQEWGKRIGRRVDEFRQS